MHRICCMFFGDELFFLLFRVLLFKNLNFKNLM
jgi:hypothetical protein